MFGILYPSHSFLSTQHDGALIIQAYGMGLFGNNLVLLSPLYLLLLSAAFIPITAYHLIKTLQFRKFTSWSAFQHAWFGRFWSWFGPRGSDACAPIVEPLLRNARGVVLDIGPGTGQWLKLFSAAKNEDITKIYGIEPNHEHHLALRAAIVRAGLEGKYEILGVGVEELDRCGIPLASIGTIATIQVLCSVREPQKIIKSLYPYLRPGGVWLVFEHVQTKHRPGLMDYWQSQYPRRIRKPELANIVLYRYGESHLALFLRRMLYYETF